MLKQKYIYMWTDAGWNSHAYPCVHKHSPKLLPY